MLAIVNLRDYPVRVSERREQILAIAAELFAQKGFHGVSISELGAACGFSGPAIYRHFRSKDAVLAEMLVSISDELLTEGRRRVRAAGTPDEALRALVDWHVTFALEHQALIVVQDRDWAALPLEAREKVRETQRKYVELWVKQLEGDESLVLEVPREVHGRHSSAADLAFDGIAVDQCCIELGNRVHECSFWTS